MRTTKRCPLVLTSSCVIAVSAAWITGCGVGEKAEARHASGDPAPQRTGESGTPKKHAGKTDPAQVAAYRAALEQILEADQRHRSAISWGTTDPDELARLEALDDEAHMREWGRRNAEGIKLDPEVEAALWEKQNALDAANTERLHELIERHGWPTEETAGPGFPSPTPVLIHMRPEDVGRILPMLREEVLAGRMPPRPYAMIYDRKQQHAGEPQLYGSSQAFDPETRTVLPPAVVDIERTNAARAEIGLGPLTDYRETDARTAAGKRGDPGG